MAHCLVRRARTRVRVLRCSGRVGVGRWQLPKQCFSDLATAPMLLFAQRMIAKAIGLPPLTLGGKALAASGGHTKTAAGLGSGFLV